jgi:hypothetical protein
VGISPRAYFTHTAKVDFGYRLTGTGWSEASISDGDQTAHLTASYLSDALGDLLSALVLLESGDAEEVRVSWEEEPGEYRWIFQRGGVDSVTLKILWFDDIYPPQGDERGRLVFETSQPLRELLRAVAGAARALVDEVGEAEYLRQWVEHPFPTAQLEQLEGKTST